MVLTYPYLHSDARFFRSHGAYIPTTLKKGSGASSFLAGTSTIRLMISYLVVLTLRGEESRCHGTEVLTWSGRGVPNACVTDTAQSGYVQQKAGNLEQ
jgi:hypothetical protein